MRIQGRKEGIAWKPMSEEGRLRVESNQNGVIGINGGGRTVLRKCHPKKGVRVRSWKRK